MSISGIVALVLIGIFLAGVIINWYVQNKKENKPVTTQGGGGGFIETPILDPKDEPSIHDEEVSQEEVEQ